MLTLYYVPGVCSLSPHIVLREGGFDFTLDRVDVRNNKLTESGKDYVRDVNPKGYVPALKLDDGTVLTEGAVMVQYLADLKPSAKLAPANGTLERVRVQEWLHFIATELHKGMSIFYQPLATDDLKAVIRARLDARFDVLAQQLEGKPFVMGDSFSIVDAYAFYVLRAYQKQVKADLKTKPTLAAYYARMSERPSVKAALALEKLEP